MSSTNRPQDPLGAALNKPPAEANGETRASGGKTAALPRLAVDIGEAAAMIGVSRAFFDEHVRHELRWVRVGRRKLVAVRELERWLDRRSAFALDDAA